MKKTTVVILLAINLLQASILYSEPAESTKKLVANEIPLGFMPQIKIAANDMKEGKTNTLSVELRSSDGNWEKHQILSRCASNFEIRNASEVRVAIGSRNSVENGKGEIFAYIAESKNPFKNGDESMEVRDRFKNLLAFRDAKESKEHSLMVYRNAQGEKVAIFERRCLEPVSGESCSEYQWVVDVKQGQEDKAATDKYLLLTLVANMAYPENKLTDDGCKQTNENWKIYGGVVGGATATAVCAAVCVTAACTCGLSALLMYGASVVCAGFVWLAIQRA